MFSAKDLNAIEKRGISLQTVENQLNIFKNGIQFLKVIAPATKERGIIQLNPQEELDCIYAWEDYLQAGGSIEKFVPASGAATRMFKDLFDFLSSNRQYPETQFEKEFFNNISKFAFYPELNELCEKTSGMNIHSLISDSKFRTIVTLLLMPEGLNYGNLPKGALKFHVNDGISCCPIEEHIEEGAQYAKNKAKEVKLHFTVSSNHREIFERILTDASNRLFKKYDCHFRINLSEQKPSSDTIAVDLDNQPFRNDDGSLLFRPGGHGALIENLNEIDSDIIFIKNIDNVVPSNKRESTLRYKKVIGGYLISLQKTINKYYKLLSSGHYTMEDVREVIHFMHDKLNVRNTETKNLEDSELVLYLLSKLKRPIRVCGMVLNDGEPGGGPFIAQNNDGTTSLQILESSQFDSNDPTSKLLLKKSTHFNPVDLVCYVKDPLGNKYDLRKFIDPNTCFISQKSKGSKRLKALELPGLWNGAMSDWNTVFVEVPLETFNPVKTVNDLLRKMHQ